MGKAAVGPSTADGDSPTDNRFGRGFAVCPPGPPPRSTCFFVLRLWQSAPGQSHCLCESLRVALSESQAAALACREACLSCISTSEPGLSTLHGQINCVRGARLGRQGTHPVSVSVGFSSLTSRCSVTSAFFEMLPFGMASAGRRVTRSRQAAQGVAVLADGLPCPDRTS